MSLSEAGKKRFEQERARRNGQSPDHVPAQQEELLDQDGEEERGDREDRDPPETLAADRPVFPPPAAPLDVARKLYSGYRLGSNGMRTLLAWRGGWMRWETTHWSEVDTAELRSRIYDDLGKVYYEHETKNGIEIKPWNPGKHKIANVIEAMEAIGHLSTDIDPPSWIDLHSAEQTNAGQVISCENGLLDLSTRALIGHTPALFNVVSVPFGYDEDAPEPVAWLEFLASVWSGDPDSVALLQEYIGYVLSGRTDMQKILLLIGPTRSGKGTVARMLTALLGRGHVAGPTLASLGTNFGLSPLLGRPLAIVSDARLGSKAPTHTIVERLLSISGEDLLTADRKFREPWSGKLPTRFVILSNELPKFKDSSGAIANRLLILRMTESFLGREDRTLDRRLSAELPGILAWALKGLDRLNREGRFTVPRSSEDATNLMMDLASPVSAFVRDCCLRRSDVTVEREVLYAMWKSWADDNGHMPGSKSTFGRDLRAVVPELRPTQPRIHGKQIWHYAGIGLLPVSPVSDVDSAGSGDADTGSPVSDTAVEPQVNGTDTGDTSGSVFNAQHQGSDTGGALLTPPSGPGRCPECGYHVPTQGHRDDCQQTEVA